MKRVLAIAMLVIAASFVGYAQTSMTPAMQNAPGAQVSAGRIRGRVGGDLSGSHLDGHSTVAAGK